MSDSVEMLPVHPFYRLSWPDGVSFDYDGEQRSMEEQIRRLSPGDVAGYRSFVEYARQVFEKGYEELAGVPFLRFADMVKVAPDLIRSGPTAPSTVPSPASSRTNTCARR